MNFSRALVTGGAGFIGSHLARGLIEEGLEVCILDNLSTGKKKNIPGGATFVEGDILDEKLMREVMGKNIDVVFHLAAKVTVRGSSDEFYNDAETNIMGTLNVLKSCRGTGVRKFIISSSMAVYGDSPSPDPIDENHRIDPRSPYGISKYTCELYVRDICRAGAMDYAILRYFNTYGPNQTFTPYVGVITIFITRLLSGQAITIFGDGRQCRDFIHVEDIVQGTIRAMHSVKEGGIYNLGTGVGNTVNDVAQALATKLKLKPQTESEPPRPEELVNSVACIEEAKTALGYAPQHTFPEGIDEVIEHIRATRPM